MLSQSTWAVTSKQSNEDSTVTRSSYPIWSGSGG